MHTSEKLLVQELGKKHNIDTELIFKLLKEAKRNSYQNEKQSKRIGEIEGLIFFYIRKHGTDK